MVRRGKRKRRKLRVDILTPAEVSALIAECSDKSPSGIRNRALLATLYQQALRLSEALALRPADLNFDSLELVVQRGKGSIHRTIELDEGIVPTLRRWIDCRREYIDDDSAPLFCTISKGKVRTPGAPLKQAYVSRTIANLRDAAKIAKRCNPHSFRHTWATESARAGVSPYVIQEFLGHADVSETLTYVAEFSAAGQRDELKKRPRWAP